MENYNTILISLSISLILGLFFYILHRKNVRLEQLKAKFTNLHVKNLELNIKLDEQEKINEELKSEFRVLQDVNIKDKELISHLKTSLVEQRNSLQKQIEILQNSEEKLKIEFENLANKIFSENSKKFAEQNRQNISSILNPVQLQISEFKKRVEDVYDKESKDRSALQQELKSLKELNVQMSKEAQNLTNALKNDNKKQGLWGEMVLERVLENSGLRKGHEYRREASLKDDKNRTFRPDVIVDLPDNRSIIIDAKTSLRAYNEYISEQNKEIKAIKLNLHVKSIKEHIKNLSLKRYEDLKGVNSLDFIFMFIPIEGALLLALESDVNLYDEAFKQKIILVSPTTLLVALRAVENTWRYEKQAQNIADVYLRAEELYKKFNGFVDDLQRVGKSLEIANNTYNEAFKKLSLGKGNLINQVTQLKNISNIKPKKELDESLVKRAMLE